MLTLWQLGTCIFQRDDPSLSLKRMEIVAIATWQLGRIRKKERRIPMMIDIAGKKNMGP